VNPVSAPTGAPALAPVPPSVGAPKSPQVNLLPPEIAARQSQGRIKALIVFMFLLFLAGIAALWFFVFGLRVVAEDNLAAEQERRLALQTELASYGYINDLAAQFENSIKAREWAGSTDIDWATHLNVLVRNVPDDITLTSLAMAQGSPLAAANGDGTAFANADMGSLVFTGRAATPDVTADLIEAFDSLPGFSDTWVDAKQIAVGTDEDTVYWEYTGATRITYTALSGRTETEQTEVPAELLEPAEEEEAN